jgi:DNA-binding response OmpR family regulator
VGDLNNSRDQGGDWIETGTEACTRAMQEDFSMPLDVRSTDFVSSPSRILLVDDDPDVRSLTKTFLEHEGYCVFSSGDAERAAHIFSSAAPIDLLITDLYMPGRSGLELAFDLKAQQFELSVLIISGGLVDLDLTSRLQEEGWRFLGKPFRLTELLSTVHVMLAVCEAERSRAS